MRITTTDQIAQTKGIKLLVYGKAGTGKTTLCGTAPSPLIISAEGGLMPLRHKRIPVVEVGTLKDIEAVFIWLRSSADARFIQTVCLDSLSEIAEVVLANEKKKTKDPRQAYGGLVDEMIPLVKGFRDMPGKHVVVTAKEEAVVNKVTGIATFGPNMPGQKVGPDLPYLFDMVFNANIGRDNEGKRYHYLRTAGDVQYIAKDRSGVLDEIEYPDLTHLFSKIAQGARQ